MTAVRSTVGYLSKPMGRALCLAATAGLPIDPKRSGRGYKPRPARELAVHLAIEVAWLYRHTQPGHGLFLLRILGPLPTRASQQVARACIDNSGMLPHYLYIHCVFTEGVPYA